LFIVANKMERQGQTAMSEESETFWVSLAEKLFGVMLVIIGAVMLYFTATSTSSLGGFSSLFGVLSAVMLIIGLFLLLVRPSE
jgi:curli biogenesis system outer membrane secretion channel CsgG